MGELRHRMVQDMDVRHFAALQRLPADVSERMVEAYVAGVKGLAKYFMRSPDQLSEEQVQRYLLHLRQERQLSEFAVSFQIAKRRGSNFAVSGGVVTQQRPLDRGRRVV
ncbi:MAG: phage integrase N-terminal SAM-like domain-containing protein [Deltaproteobacteria bacterium]|nr:phage integrase N-terminal SAM-like domain-containing protein [Deltaproteobacteria bacterium]